VHVEADPIHGGEPDFMVGGWLDGARCCHKTRGLLALLLRLKKD
jgi:hypothetical protein